MKSSIWKRVAALSAAACALITGAIAPKPAAASVTGVFGGGPFYNNATNNINELKNAGFSEVIVWNIQVRSNGDLNFNGEFPVCSNGSYVGGSTHPDFASNMATLKTGCVTRVTFSIGSSNIGDFQDIRDLVNSQGTGSTSILYKNFLALKQAIPALDAIDLDDENCYDTSTMVKFCVMLADLGYNVALDPYTNSAFWTGVASQVNSQRPGAIDSIHLQCYDGGGGNNPCSWNFNGIPVYPGMWTNGNSPASVQTQMTNWKNQCGIKGGWMWLYDSFVGSSSQWAAAINNGIGGQLPTAYFMIVNKSSGKAIDLIGGNTANGAAINTWAYDYNGPNQRWAFRPTESSNHFKLMSWVSAKCACIDGDSLSAGATLHEWDYVGSNPGQQFDLVDAGNGWYRIKNVKSGLYLQDMGSGTGIQSPSNNITQQPNAAVDTQLWRLQPWGTYKIRTSTGHYICVQGAGGQNGAQIIQYVTQDNSWFKWTFTNEGDGWYGLFSQNSPTRVISVVNSSTANAANTQLWDYNVNNVGDQKVRILPKTNGRFKFYFKHDGMTWDIPGGQYGNDIHLQQYPDNGNIWQEFYMERTPL